MRYSPTRHVPSKPEEFPERAGPKPVRAYEPSSQAPKQAMYSGGYRPNIREKEQYPAPGTLQRPVEQRGPSWQDRDKAMFNEAPKKREEERNSGRMPFERPGLRLDKEQKISHSPRKSRSPMRRDKSPSRDRFKRHSPSPRSPRRSWALEKRRSPEVGEAPPPPIWPGQVARPDKRPDFDDVEPKRRPGWEYEKKVIDDRRPEDERRFPVQGSIRVRGDLTNSPPPRREPEFKREYPREDLKYDPREAFESKRPKFDPRDEFEKKGPKFAPRDDFEKEVPKYIPRDDFDKKGSKYNPREDFDKKQPVFDPRDDHAKSSRFGPRDDYEDKRPKFAPREDFEKAPKFTPHDDYQDPKYSRDALKKDPKFAHDFERPKFSHREEYEERRDDFRKHDVPERKSWDAPSKAPPTEVYKSDLVPKREEPFRNTHPRKEAPWKYSEELEKEYEDVHERAKDFQKKVEEYRRDDRRRDFDRKESEPKPYDERLKHRNDDRRDFRSDDRRKEDWTTDEHFKSKAGVIAAMKAKKEKAVGEIAQKILDKHNIDAEADYNRRLCAELRIAVAKIINDMFGESDISYIELVLKFNAKYSGAREDKILKDVMSSFPVQFRPKQSAPDYSEGPSKSSRRSPVPMSHTERRPYPPAGRPKPVRNEFIDAYEKERIPHHSPAKKPRLEHSYHEPERRAAVKPAHPITEPKVTKNPAVIEKKPVLNVPSKSVADYPPLPQRKPVQKPKQKPEPKPEPKPIPKQPVKQVQEKPETPKPVVKKQPAVETKTQEAKKTVAEKTKPVEVAKKESKLKEEVPEAIETSPEHTGGHYQLNALMSRALKNELQVINTEVLAQLTDASSPSERVVANHLRKVMGEHFFNALGLNVTSRLLQVHNPLYLKLQFSGKPEAGCLQAFIGKYNITAFKRIESTRDTFAARVETIQHFDRLCHAKEVTCGSATVAVTPCYKFLTCPPALKSIYGGKTGEVKEEKPSNTVNADAKTEIKIKDDICSENKQNAHSKDSEVEEDKKKQPEAKAEVIATPPAKTTTEISPVKVNITIEAKGNSVDVNEKAQKVNKNEPQKVSKNEPQKVNKNEPQKVNKNEPQKVNKNEPQKVNKKEPQKETQIETANKVTSKSNVVSRTKKEISKIMEELMVVDELEGGDDEEMTDKDILALMSGGIVLDECSGSDEDEK